MLSSPSTTLPVCILTDNEPESSERDWRVLERARQRDNPETVSRVAWACVHAPRGPAYPNYKRKPPVGRTMPRGFFRSGSTAVRGFVEVGRG